MATIMDKAFEEANFADVYADLCKEFDVRTSKKPWSFVHTMVDSALQEVREYFHDRFCANTHANP